MLRRYVVGSHSGEFLDANGELTRDVAQACPYELDEAHRLAKARGMLVMSAPGVVAAAHQQHWRRKRAEETRRRAG